MMMNLACFARFQDDADLCSLGCTHQMMVDSTTRQETTQSDSVFRNGSITQDDHREFVIDCLLCFLANSIDRFEQSSLSSRTIKRNVDRLRFPTTSGHVLDRYQLIVGKNRMLNQQPMAVRWCRGKQILFRADIALERHDDVFSNRINGRVGDLREELFEVVIYQTRLITQTSKCRIISHRADRIHLGIDHRQKHELHCLDRITKRLHPWQQRFRMEPMSFHRTLQIRQRQSLLLEPILVRLKLSKRFLDFCVGNQSAFFKVDQEHAARLKSPFFLDDCRVDRKHAHFAGHDDTIIVGQIIATWSQPISIQCSPDVLAVGENDGSWAVPGFHHAA